MAVLRFSFNNNWRLPRGKKNFAGRLAQFFVVALTFFALTFATRAQSPLPEYKLKAVFLFNFVQFVDWPTNAFPEEKSPIIIGVLGTDPFEKILEETVQGESVRNRSLEVRRYKSVKEIEECHVLFISSSEVSKMEPIIARLKGRNILTVSDAEGFAVKYEGMVQFFKEKNKLRFRINIDVVKAANLSVSSKLLQLAEIVTSDKSRR